MSLTHPAPRTGSTPAPTAHAQHHGAAHPSPSAPRRTVLAGRGP